ncbi:hypothetical protein NIES23_61130 (plasmid) [Trichormus variabilis NIES-23]|uniref:Uncharacterized protein n=1 Tax=Trichormus variabilis NIES-23 TaxID=1973479 RepID=A0A1Z4KW75_ANAVA|nr:hypothetical protein NIES23_61130 [Trichormus variabilis NIES-23]
MADKWQKKQVCGQKEELGQGAGKIGEKFPPCPLFPAPFPPASCGKQPQSLHPKALASTFVLFFSNLIPMAEIPGLLEAAQRYVLWVILLLAHPKLNQSQPRVQNLAQLSLVFLFCGGIFSGGFPPLQQFRSRGEQR